MKFRFGLIALSFSSALLQLVFAHVGREMNDLPLQIAEIHRVELDHADGADARRSQVQRNGRAESARTDEQHFRCLEPFLTLHADFRENQVARIAFDIFVGQFRAVFDDRLNLGEIAARNRRNDGDLVAFVDGSIVALGANVLVVDVHAHEIAQFAVLAVEVRAQLGVLGR